MSLPIFQSADPVLMLLQTKWAALLNPALDSSEQVVVISANADLTPDTTIVGFNAAKNIISSALPSVNVAGTQLVLEKLDSSFNAITINAPKGSYIETGTQTSLNTQGEALILLADGLGYRIIERRIPGTPVTYTPTWTSPGTAPAIGNGTIRGQYRRIGDSIALTIYLVTGTTTTFGSANTWLFSLPAGLVANPLASDPMGIGKAFAIAGASSLQFGGTPTVYPTLTDLDVRAETAGTALWNSTNPATWNAPTAQFITIQALIPISGWKA